MTQAKHVTLLDTRTGEFIHRDSMHLIVMFEGERRLLKLRLARGSMCEVENGANRGEGS